MQKRNFKDFLQAYLEYAHDGFVPEQFNTWSGISIVAGALERKVWLPWTIDFNYYPNMYILLVSMPGEGKSTALNRAVDLLLELHRSDRAVNLLPSQLTEAKLIELMGERRPVEYAGNKIGWQCSAYYYASEASNSLKDVYGDITTCMTDFYDCPQFWEKATKKDDRITLENVSFNLLAGSTFDYLGKLVTNENILGGFASRLTYVVSRESTVKHQKFRFEVPTENKEKMQYRAALIDDLRMINQMVGPFRGDAGYGAAWEEWSPVFQQRRIDMPSEKMKSLLVRMNTSLYKLSMILSASESDDRVLKKHHFDKAIELLEKTESTLPQIFREARSSNVNTHDGLNAAIFMLFGKQNAIVDEKRLVGNLVLRNFDPLKVEAQLKSMIGSGGIKMSVADGRTMYQLLLNPDEHL